jgi:ABC-type branched-subunit amino acid transport system substrate-binding protein
MKLSQSKYIILFIAMWQSACMSKSIEEINIGFIAPLTTRATDLGVGPANAMQMAVDNYNSSIVGDEPRVNLFLADDEWDRRLAKPLYEKLRSENKIDILFISNSDGTVELQNEIIRDKVIAINPLNSDALLSSLNENTFKIAKSTEAANELIAIRILELGLKKVYIMHYPNDFMTRAANAIKSHFEIAGIQYQIEETDASQTSFNKELRAAKEMGAEAIVFLGYKEYGHAMKEARDMDIEAQFFGSTVLMDLEYYDNSEGEIVGTEFCFFTPADGNYFLADEFLTQYEKQFETRPVSIWPPMQAHDAMTMVLNQIKSVNHTKESDQHFSDWLRLQLHKVRFHQGVCGNLSITPDGSSRGIYFSMYKYTGKGEVSKIKR